MPDRTLGYLSFLTIENIIKILLIWRGYQRIYRPLKKE